MQIQPRLLGTYQRWTAGALAAAMFVAFSLAAGRYLPVGIDWHLSIRSAALAITAGESPYNSVSAATAFGGPPWVLLALIPLALLPESIGRGFLFTVSLFGFAYAAYRLRAKPPVMLAFLLSPPVMHCLFNANLDWIPILGYSLTPWAGLFFISVKPQMGSVVALFWLVEAWRKGGPRQVARTFAPITAAFGISLAVYGFWPANMFKMAEYTTWWNASFWPSSIPVGLALAVAAVRLRNMRYAMAASPCLSPHVLLHSWSAALAGLLNSPAELIAAVVGLWLLLLIRALGITL